MKKSIIACLVAAFIGTSALAHTNSIGYVGDGSGGLNFWYGNWHPSTTFNEAEIKITRPDGTTSISAFNLLSSSTPAGLISGVNYFSSDGTQLIPYNPSTVHPMGMPMTSYVWQGMNYTGLSAGTYTFTYIPLGDAESSWPTGMATADWMPMDEVIRSLTITLTTGDLTGDANNNGILDILEFPVGSPAPTPDSGSTVVPTPGSGLIVVPTPGIVLPTVVSQGSSMVVGYVAVTSGVVQVVRRTETHTTWDNMSDGSIQNTHSHVTTLSDAVGRVDQGNAINLGVVAAGNGINVGAFDAMFRSDTGNFFVAGDTTRLNAGGYKITTNYGGFGGDRVINKNWRLGGQIGKLNTNASGNNSTAGADHDVVGAYAIYSADNGALVATNLVNASGKMAASRQVIADGIAEFNNSMSADTDTTWLHARAYAPSVSGIRPFVGYTTGSTRTGAYVESGSVQTARTGRATSNNFEAGELGLRAEYTVKGWNLSGEIAAADNNLVSTRATAAYKLDKNSAVMLTVRDTTADGAHSTGVAVSARFGF